MLYYFITQETSRSAKSYYKDKFAFFLVLLKEIIGREECLLDAHHRMFLYSPCFYFPPSFSIWTVHSREEEIL